MHEPDYAFYRDEYHGVAPEAAFNGGLADAVARVDWVIGPRRVTDETATAYKRAVCSVLEVHVVHGAIGGGVSIGGFSANGSGRSVSSMTIEAVYRELAGTGLLFQGIA